LTLKRLGINAGELQVSKYFSQVILNIFMENAINITQMATTIILPLELIPQQTSERPIPSIGLKTFGSHIFDNP
jgi:hypothetical protein